MSEFCYFSSPCVNLPIISYPHSSIYIPVAVCWHLTPLWSQRGKVSNNYDRTEDDCSCQSKAGARASEPRKAITTRAGGGGGAVRRVRHGATRTGENNAARFSIDGWSVRPPTFLSLTVFLAGPKDRDRYQQRTKMRAYWRNGYIVTFRLFNPFDTAAVPFWGQTTQIPSCLSPKRDWLQYLKCCNRVGVPTCDNSLHCTRNTYWCY